MNTTQKIGLVSGVAWLVIVGTVYIAGTVLTGSLKAAWVYALVVVAPALLIWKMTGALGAITKWFKE